LTLQLGIELIASNSRLQLSVERFENILEHEYALFFKSATS
jgi:hypothetical protein